MAHLGRLRDYEFDNGAEDIRGSGLYGINDEKLGEIDDVIFDHANGNICFLVVDTGGWLSSNKFIVPADRVRPYHKDKDDFYAGLSRERIEQLPAYDEKMLDKEEMWAEYEERHRTSWSESPVLHQEGTSNIITPPANQIPAASDAPTAEMSLRDIGGPDPARFTPARIADKFEMPKMPQTSPKPMESTRTAGPLPQADPVTGRLDRFQHSLRSRRDRWAEACPECKDKAA